MIETVPSYAGASLQCSIRVRLRNIPLADFRRFVKVLAQANPELRHLDRAPQIPFRRRHVDRIAAQNQQQIHLPGIADPSTAPSDRPTDPTGFASSGCVNITVVPLFPSTWLM